MTTKSSANWEIVGENLEIYWGDTYWIDILPKSFFYKECADADVRHKLAGGVSVPNSPVSCKLTVQGKLALLDYRVKTPKGCEKGVINIRFADKRRIKVCDVWWTTDFEIEEGKRSVVEAQRLSRSSTLAHQRKAYDSYKCQACGYYLEVDGKYVADCHHWHELGKEPPTINGIKDLITLCPNCHRIAHAMSRAPKAMSAKEEVKRIRRHLSNDYMYE